MITKYLIRKNKRINPYDHNIVVMLDRRTDSFGKTLCEVSIISDGDIPLASVSRDLAELSATILDQAGEDTPAEAW